ncbi:MAG TPA: DUF2723 domain-containing protein [Vicinamibacterales bacterium]
MKVSASVRPEHVIAAAFVAAHIPSLSPTLEDIDSLNFALGLRDFDPALHQPHPPGYPVYIALGRASYAVVSRATPSLDRLATEALSLSIWSIVAAAISIIAAASFFRALLRLDRDSGLAIRDSDVRSSEVRDSNPESRTGAPAARLVRGGVAIPSPETWAAALLAASPLFWMTGLRPMSDMPGLAAALVALMLAAKALADRRWLPWAALVAGLAAGIRLQTVWLTLPMLAVAMIFQRGAGTWWLLSRPLAALAAGGLAWAIPLIAASGGVAGYMRALGTQAELDFAGVDMVWLNPTPRRLAFSLYETLVMPWVSIPVAVSVAVVATVGAIVLLLRERRALFVVLVAFGPYTVFHLLFQETLTVRYALPIVPLLCWFAARGVTAAGRVAPLVGVPLVGAALLAAVPGGLAYGREPHPAFRAIDDALRRARVAPPAATYAHYALRRPLEVVDAHDLRVRPPRHQVEWLGLVEYWRSGGRETVWLLADPRRTDLALIDPHATRDVMRYGWLVASRPELSGTRPTGVDWYRIAPPGWFAGEGWSLTPETGGQARATAKGPDQQPIQAWVRRLAAPMHVMVGVRHLGAPGDPAAEMEVAIDGRVLDRWTLAVDEPNSLRFLELPAGIPGGGDYAMLTVSSRAAGGDRRRAPVAVRQFDVQQASLLIYGFGEGWHELEFDTTSGRLWRWSSDRSVLRLHGPPQAVRLTLRGESPLRYFDSPPTVTVSAAGRPVAQFRPSADFEWSTTVPADVIAQSAGAITIAMDRAYLPGVAEGTADGRRLGLRLFDVRVHPVSP